MKRPYTDNREENSKKSWFSLSRKTLLNQEFIKIIHLFYIPPYLNYVNVAWASTY